MCPRISGFPVIRIQILPNASQRSVTVSTETDVNKFLNSIELEAIGRPLGKIGRVLEVDRSGDVLSAKITLGLPIRSKIEAIRAQIMAELARETGAAKVDIELSTKISSHAVQGNLKPVDGIKNIIAIASGKYRAGPGERGRLGWCARC
jgi:ATP-binding protein involved in chromosome partitioning